MGGREMGSEIGGSAMGADTAAGGGGSAIALRGSCGEALGDGATMLAKGLKGSGSGSGAAAGAESTVAAAAAVGAAAAGRAGAGSGLSGSLNGLNTDVVKA